MAPNEWSTSNCFVILTIFSISCVCLLYLILLLKVQPQVSNNLIFWKTMFSTWRLKREGANCCGVVREGNLWVGCDNELWNVCLLACCKLPKRECLFCLVFSWSRDGGWESRNEFCVTSCGRRGLQSMAYFVFAHGGKYAIIKHVKHLILMTWCSFLFQNRFDARKFQFPVCFWWMSQQETLSK